MGELFSQGNIFATVLEEFIRNSGQGLLGFCVKLVVAILILVIGLKCVKYIENFCRHIFERSNMDVTLQTFLLSAIRIGCKVIIIFWAITKIGVAASSVIALVGSAGIALGLSLQGSLSNIAGGVILLFMKPFLVGDYIMESSSGNEGYVAAIGIMYTRINTLDHRSVLVPNGNLLGSTIVNVTANPERMEDITVGIEYSENIQKVRAVLQKLIDEEEACLKDKKIEIFVNGLLDSCIEMRIRFWVKNDDYWTCRWRVLERIKEEFDANGICIPFNQLDVNVVNQNSEN